MSLPLLIEYFEGAEVDFEKAVILAERAQEYDASAIVEYAIGTAPTQQQIDNILSDTLVVGSQPWSQWIAEHGGDAVLTLRREAKEFLDAQKREAMVQRASDIEIALFARETTRRLNELLQVIADGNNLAAIKSGAAAIAAQPIAANEQAFMAAARAAIKARIDNAEADS